MSPIEHPMLRPLKIAYEYFALYTSLALLGLICLTWSVFAIPLYFILPRRLGTAVGRRGIMSGFRIYAWSLSITRTHQRFSSERKKPLGMTMAVSI